MSVIETRLGAWRDQLEVAVEKRARHWRLMLALIAAGFPGLATACMDTAVEPVPVGVAIGKTAKATEAQPGDVETQAGAVPTEQQPPMDEPSPTLTPTPEPTPELTPEPTPTPELGVVNDQNQWWDGESWQALPEGEGWVVSVAEDGQVTAKNFQGEISFFINGEWLTEAQIETKKVVEYVKAQTEVINRVSLETIEFRASHKLQRAIYDRLPPEVQAAVGEHPLYMMIWNAPRLEEVIGNLVIPVKGLPGPVRLGDYPTVISFHSSLEELPANLDFYHGTDQQNLAYDAFYDEQNKRIIFPLRVSSNASEGYLYDSLGEYHLIFQGLIPALANISGLDPVVFQQRFYEDTPYDDKNIDGEVGITWLLVPGVGNPRRGSSGSYLTDAYFDELHNQGWLPKEVWGLMSN